MTDIPSELAPRQSGYRLSHKVSNRRFQQIAETMHSKGYDYIGNGAFRRPE